VIKFILFDVYNEIKLEHFQVRGTVQADILKKIKRKNTCIFSTEFAFAFDGWRQSILLIMLNFYSVSISGYHIAEAGANYAIGIHAFKRLYIYEYYLSRGMNINDF
jgi:methylmalonyl-CoA mutase N-terminal domain/subunit